MSFYGCEFIFDGKPCTEMGLMIYDFGSSTQSDVSFPSSGKIIEDRIASRYDSFLYGVQQNDPLEFTLVFGANIDSVDANVHIDRYEIEEIASWLTGHNTRKWLEILQPDMTSFRYKCIISDLQLVTYGNMPWAFSCRVTCDSPFGYTHKEKYTINVNGSKTVSFFNRSTYNGFYRPNILITTNDVNLSIVNHSDDDREFLFENLPTSSTLIKIDNKNQVITDEASGINLYPYFNFNFLRFVRGENVLEFSGDFVIEIECEFPVNIGG